MILSIQILQELIYNNLALLESAKNGKNECILFLPITLKESDIEIINNENKRQLYTPFISPFSIDIDNKGLIKIFWINEFKKPIQTPLQEFYISLWNISDFYRNCQNFEQKQGTAFYRRELNKLKKLEIVFENSEEKSKIIQLASCCFVHDKNEIINQLKNIKKIYGYPVEFFEKNDNICLICKRDLIKAEPFEEE
jgi:hypothetical protein